MNKSLDKSKGSFKELNNSKPASSKNTSKQNISVKGKETSSNISILNMPKFEDPKTRSHYQERLWLKKHGKNKFIQFDDTELLELRKYFTALDADGGGMIDVEELEDPLIALGLAQSHEEVENLVKAVDDDKSGHIEFKEFLSIMSSVKNDEDSEKSPIFLFFKKMINGELMEEMEKNLPFKLNVSQFRRRKILDAIMNPDPKKKEVGQKIMQAYKKLLIANKRKQKEEKGENPNDISLDQIPNNENGEINTRNGFQKMKRILEHNTNYLVKPKSTTINNLTSNK